MYLNDNKFIYLKIGNKCIDIYKNSIELFLKIFIVNIRKNILYLHT